jgi:hypothetical protein
MRASKQNRSTSDEQDNLFADYDEFAKVLRTWFVAYGIGGPVLLLTNDKVREKIAASGWSRCIASAFLFGVGLQILLAIFNKSALWFCYLATRHPERSDRLIYRIANWFAYDFWIDFLIDIMSLAALGWATYEAFSILTA